MLRPSLRYPKIGLLLTLATVAGTPLAARQPATDPLPAGVHRQLLPHLDDAEKRVELFWQAPRGDGRHPALLLVHGHQFGDRPGARRYVDRGTLRRLARSGYVAAGVSQPGYGTSDGPPDFCGPFTHRAVHAAIAVLRANPRVDPERIALFGYSRGAIVSSVVASEDDRLAAVVLGAGEYDLVDAWQRMDPEGWPDRGIMANMKKESGATPDALRARSALHQPKPSRVPTLMLHGEDDDRAAIANARDYAARLHAAGTPVELATFRGIGHGIPRTLQRARFDRFLARWLRTPGHSR